MLYVVLGVGALVAIQTGAGVCVGFRMGKRTTALPALESEMAQLKPPPGSVALEHRATPDFDGASVVDTYRYDGAQWPDVRYVMVETFTDNGWTPVSTPSPEGRRVDFRKVGVPFRQAYLDLEGSVQPVDAKDAGFTFAVEVTWHDP